MYKLSTVAALLILVFLSFSQTTAERNYPKLLSAFVSAESHYQKAAELSDRAGDNEQLITVSDNMHLAALEEYKLLLPELKRQQFDSLYVLAAIKTGLIYHYFDSTQEAKQAYLAAIQAKEKLAHLPDSVLFQPFLFTGSICYTNGEFDSAFYYLKKAEAIKNSYNTQLREEQRLYNLLGVLHYETGNLKQSNNYIKKAIATMAENKVKDISLLTNYQLNISSILIKLQEYEKAETLLKSIISNNVYTDEIKHALGFICLKTGRQQEAIRYFDQVKYTGSKKIIDLYLNKSKAFEEINEPDSSTYYLLSAKTENLKWNGSRRNISNGIIYKQEAEAMAARKLYPDALVLFQQSLLQFSNTFTDTATSANPEVFSGVFAYIDLFNILIAKGDLLKILYDKDRDIRHLEASLNAYRSAFKLADYVEKTYDSDEARLFLGKIKHTVHSKPIDISLLLYDLTHKVLYLEEAYLFDQRNKASVLSFNVQANDILSQAGPANNLLHSSALLRSAITRLSLKAATLTDTTELQQLYTRIRDNEIELGKLQEQINADPLWQKKNAIKQIPLVAELQKRLDPTTTLLSFHLSDNELLTLLISANQFTYHKIQVSKSFYAYIDTLQRSLHATAPDGRYAGTGAAMHLYQLLIQPVQQKLQQKKRLIIIPDDELNYLPFEALQDENKQYLLEKFSIQYQFSTALATQVPAPLNPSAVMAFAPFATAGYGNATGDSFSVLPASKEETSQLKGQLYADAAATKTNFLRQPNRYSIIHLATHASVNNEDPMRSFIAFHPGEKEYKLYAQEIYDLKLDSLQLIILSACETGAGQLVKGEGLMSLSRAFTYAGCPNIITSLWKAEDKTTAFITNRLHYYLGKKYTKDHALQQAKLDLLNNTEIDPRLKAPNYWAHLVFIGNYEADHRTRNWWWVAITIIVGALLYRYWGRKK